jgi:hypothetical protein
MLKNNLHRLHHEDGGPYSYYDREETSIFSEKFYNIPTGKSNGKRSGY